MAIQATEPPGEARSSRVAAFFDFDGTLFDCHPPKASLRAWRGRSADELIELGERLFRQHIAANVFPEAWRLVRSHIQRGHTVVIVSSATRFHIEPLARDFGVEHLLCTAVEVEDGILTGRANGPLLNGDGKAQVVCAFAAEHGIDLADSYAYSHGDEDIPFLETVEHPQASRKKGGFQMAMQAGVPVVPIVIRNTGELMWRNSLMLRPGGVQVVVHPPISTDDWSVAELSDHVAQVRQLHLETLDNCPQADPTPDDADKVV